jgi:hypothetical protein
MVIKMFIVKLTGIKRFGNACSEFNCTQECVNGYCNGPDRCSCVSGYTGFSCEIPICNPPCPNTTEGGWCVSANRCNATVSTTALVSDEQNVEGEDEEESAFPMGVVIGVVAGVLVLFAVAAVILVLSRRNAKHKKSQQAENMELEFSGFGKYIIPYKKLKFSHKLGEGNFGVGRKLCFDCSHSLYVVYKGEYNHAEVAIKQIHEKLISRKDLEAFQEEAKLMGELPPHPNG